MGSQINIGPAPDYKVDPNNGNIGLAKDGTLTVHGSKDGCVLCFSVAVNGSTQYDFTPNEKQDISFQGVPVSPPDVIYTVNAPGWQCNQAAAAARTAGPAALAHTIIIGSGDQTKL